MLKIAFLSFEYPPETGYGGIGTYTWYQARALVKLGHEVHVFCGASEPMQLKSYEHDGVKVFRFRNDSRLMRGFKQLNKLRWWWTKNRLENALSMFTVFRNSSKEYEYDLVEMPECGAEGLLINNFVQIKTVIRLHSPSRLIMPYYDVPKADITVCGFLEQIGIRKAFAFSACSKFMAEQALSKLGVRRPIRVIPNGIDLLLFDAVEQIDVRKKFDLPQNRIIIFFSGRMESRKGIHLCKEIVTSILERFEVAFVFAGQDLFRYMADTLFPYWKTKKFRGSFHYIGRVDPVTLRSCLREADIFLLPSLWENCPYSCLEAMAARCAIVSTDQGGMTELLQNGTNGNGLLAVNEDVTSYINQIQELIEDSNLRKRIGAAARLSVEQSFTDTRVAQLSADYYLEILNQTEKRDRASRKHMTMERV